MNALVPNITWSPGHNIARALRPACDRLVATFVRHRPPLLRSRLLDAAYELTTPDDPEDYPAYLGRLLDICDAHKIDVIFPADDVTAKIIAWYGEELLAAGVTPVVNEFEVTRRAQDKFAVAEVAEKVGYPGPKTVLCVTDTQAVEAAEEVGFPLVLKSTNSRGSMGVRFVRDGAGLLRGLRDLKDEQGLIVQEYIPGNKERSLNLLLDSAGEVLLSFTLRKIHYLKPSLSTAVEVVESPPEMEAAVELARRLGLKGFCAIQTKVDARDGRYKLIEVNPRFGNNARILFSFGLNLPVACVDIARGKPVAAESYPVGLRGVSPFEDWAAFGVYLWARLRRAGDGFVPAPSNPMPTVRSMLRSYARLYGRAVVFDDHSANLFRDTAGSLDYYIRLVRDLRSFPADWQYFIPWGEVE